MRICLTVVITTGIIIGVAIWYVNYTDKPSLVGIVVPHHDLVASVRQAYFKEVAATVQPKTIIMVSTDHFETNSAPIVAADKTWQTILGDIPSNQDLITELGLVVDNTAFDGEHGITTLLRETKENFPSSNIVAIKINRAATYATVGDLTEQLFASCPECLIMASVDFSHSVTAEIAYLHDTVTLRELEAVDPLALYRYAEIDSPETLAMLALWARLHDAQRFSLFSYTNSGFIAERSVGEITSHIIGGYTTGEKVTANANTVGIMMAGDTMFARSVSRQTEDVFAKLGNRFFWGADVALLNLEGVFSDNTDSLNDDWGQLPPIFRFDPEYVSDLKRARLTHVGLSNNHSNDGGKVDLEYTSNQLISAGLEPIQTPETNAPSLVTRGSTTIAIITESTFRNTEDLAPLISKHEQAGHVVIVFAHFGREYEPTHSAEQEALAHHWIDTGADIIVGSHPHRFQDIAVYKNRPIIYSLGNFVFDQNQSPETMIGAVLGGIITESNIELFITPVHSYLRPHVLDNETTQTILSEWMTPWQSFKTEKNTFIFQR